MSSLSVMAGLVPAIHVLRPSCKESKTWITATSAVMTTFVRGSDCFVGRAFSQ
jgi:hypothetical protein